MLGLLFVAVTFGALIGGQFFLPGNLELIARQTAIVSAAALGMTIVIVSAGIDLSVGSVVALTTVAIALLLRAGSPPLAAAIGGVAAAAVCGLVNGIARHRLARGAVHRDPRHDDPRARRGEGPGGGAPHRSAADLAQRPAPRHRSR